jgi:hypothetical protein
VLAADIFCKLELLRWWWYIALGDLCQSFCSSQKEIKKKKKKNKQSISEEQLLFSPFICTEEAHTCSGDFCTCTEFHNPISLSYFQIV